MLRPPFLSPFLPPLLPPLPLFPYASSPPLPPLRSLPPWLPLPLYPPYKDDMTSVRNELEDRMSGHESALEAGRAAP